MMKNAMFQFYDGRVMVDDTGLIELEEAMKLFESRRGDFSNAMALGLDCQMCIWHECKHDEDYRLAFKDWHSSNVKFDGRHFWIKE